MYALLIPVLYRHSRVMIILLRFAVCRFTALLNGLRATEVAKARDVCRGVHYTYIISQYVSDNIYYTYIIVCDCFFYSSISREAWAKYSKNVIPIIFPDASIIRSLNSLCEFALYIHTHSQSLITICTGRQITVLTCYKIYAFLFEWENLKSSEDSNNTYFESAGPD